MTARRRVVVVDDDATIRALLEVGLERSGFAVQAFSNAAEVLSGLTEAPAAVVVDLMMPGMGGLEFCQQLRAHPLGATVPLVVLSGKTYDSDRTAALRCGADVFIDKPVDVPKLAAAIERLCADRVSVEFWGVRGTLPAPAATSVRYGGNTSCMSVVLPRGERFIFDAGTGIRSLGAHIMASGERQSSAILITHPHWDHINALPFFAPLYVPGNQHQICGPAQPGAPMRELVRSQMDGTFFPITPRELGADITYTDLRPGRSRILGTEVHAIQLMHPGTCLGYRLDYGGRHIAWITDQELSQPGMPGFSQAYVEQLARFLDGVDLLVTDTTYTDAEYPKRVGWGHSSVSQVADLAHRAAVKTLCIAHHDPAQTDDDIDHKLDAAGQALAALGSRVTVTAPAEGDTLAV